MQWIKPISAGTGFPTALRTTQGASTMEVMSLIRGALYAASPARKRDHVFAKLEFAFAPVIAVSRYHNMSAFFK